MSEQDSKPGRPVGETRREDGTPAIAVAISHQPESGQAPKVLAGGRGAVAEQILQIAFAHGIKVREDADLAQMLSAIDVDSEIPLDAFAAVAEILAYVYRANGNLPSFTEAAATTDPTP